MELSPTRGRVGSLVHITGKVSPVAACPDLRTTVAADAASGAAALVQNVRVDATGRYSAEYRVPDTSLTGRSGPQAVRVSCERADHHALNVGSTPLATFTVD